MNLESLFRSSIFMLAIAFLVILAACEDTAPSSSTPTGRDVVEREGSPDVVYYDDEDDLMNRAVAQAKATYSEFVLALEAEDPAILGLSVKKPFEAKEGYEHIWISDISWDGQAFSGTVGNEPVDVPGLTYGQAVTVTPEELSDWMYIRDGMLHGGYTLRVTLSEYPPEERAAMEREMGFKVPEIDF